MSGHSLLLRIAELAREDEAANAHMFAGAMDADQIAQLFITEIGGGSATETLAVLDTLRAQVEEIAGQKAIVVA